MRRYGRDEKVCSLLIVKDMICEKVFFNVLMDRGSRWEGEILKKR